MHVFMLSLIQFIKFSLQLSYNRTIDNKSFQVFHCSTTNRKDQRHRREEVARTPATFSCDQCLNFFSSQKDLDDHICKHHTFICQICQHISKTLPELDFHIDIMHDTTPRSLPAKHPEDKEMVCEWRHRTMAKEQQKELDCWREAKDMAAKERWDEYWAAWTAQKSLDKEKEKGKKRKRYRTKEEAEAASGDDKDRDPHYVQSEEDSSKDPLYEPSRKELRRADEEGDK